MKMSEKFFTLVQNYPRILTATVAYTHIAKYAQNIQDAIEKSDDDEKAFWYTHTPLIVESSHIGCQIGWAAMVF
jgi:hypothetical protein